MAVINLPSLGRRRLGNCLASDSVGDLVFITGPIVGGRVQVTKVDVDDADKMPAYGVITEKATATDCTVLVEGTLAGSFNPNAIYFAGVGGTIVEGPPPRPVSGYRRVQVVGQADDSGALDFKPDRRYSKITSSP
jgi:hypothetical protein